MGLLFTAREKVLNNLKSKLFPIKNLCKVPTPQVVTEPTPEVATEPIKAAKTKPKTKLKISTLKLCEELSNEIKIE